ncbi:hypothetical protein M426DRAFT_325041 [Hypoxylon sp. CI-4A]|nr:hypothetical protein M426DRAFT_325041 [Hypoxylon sp. CI-4A]
MNNFGVVELASTKTTNAPGWAYVPDTTPNLAAAMPLQPGNRKRAARNQATASTSAVYADADARQEAKLRREIEALDRDNYHRDVSIPVAAAAKSAKAASAKKHTPNVRKILQSQKTFANHLDDYEALKGTSSAGHTAATEASSTAAVDKTAQGRRGTRGEQQQQQQQSQAQKSKSKKQTKSTSRSASISKAAPSVKQEEDVEMTDAPSDSAAAAAEPTTTTTTTNTTNDTPRSTILTPYARPGPTPPARHPEDANPLLTSRVPPLPTDAELRELLKAPPLSYTEARGRWSVADDCPRYPARVFCEVCGYWGRVRCMKCGARVCALECLETHREECVTRYGL